MEKIALMYLGKMYQFKITNFEATKTIEKDGIKFMLSEKNYFIDTTKGIVRREKNGSSWTYIQYEKNIFLLNTHNNMEIILEHTNIGQLKENITNTFNEIIDFSEKSEKEIIDFFTITKKAWQEEKEKEAKDELKRLEKERQENEKREKAIKEAKAKVLNNEKINNEEFELLLKHYKIDVHMRTLGFIREKLVSISKNTYSSYGSSISEKVFTVYNELLKQISNDIL